MSDEDGTPDPEAVHHREDEARLCGVAPTPGTATVTPTTGAPCPPSVTASQSVNCRLGPSTDYEAVGALSPGMSALTVPFGATATFVASAGSVMPGMTW